MSDLSKRLKKLQGSNTALKPSNSGKTTQQKMDDLWVESTASNVLPTAKPVQQIASSVVVKPDKYNSQLRAAPKKTLGGEIGNFFKSTLPQAAGDLWDDIKEPFVGKSEKQLLTEAKLSPKLLVEDAKIQMEKENPTRADYALVKQTQNVIKKYGMPESNIRAISEDTTQLQKQLKSAEKTWQVSPVDATLANAGAAATSMFGNLGSFANSLGADKVPLLKEVTNFAVDGARKAQENAQQYNRGDYGEALGAVTQGIVNLVPYFVLGTGKTAVKGATTVTKYGKYIEPVIKNPSFWYSLTSMWGNKYQEKLDEGYNRFQALGNAIMYALPAALVEVSGGIGAKGKETQSLLRTMGEEIAEEIVQDIISGTSDKITTNHDLPVLSTTEDAIINPINLAKTAVYTAPIVAISGGANRTINNSINNRIENKKIQAQINQDLGMIRNSADYQRAQQTNMLPTYSQIQQANLAQNQANQQQNIQSQQTIQPQTETAQKGEIQMPTAKTNAVYNTAKQLNVDTQLANRVMEMAKLVDVSVNGFVDVNENIDGYNKDGAIYINKNSEKPQDRIFVHELTHNLEKADGWQGLRDTIFNSNVLYNELAEKGLTLDEYRQLIKDRYAENGIELNEDDVDREVIAKFAEEHLLKDQKSIDRMVQENPTFMQRVKNFIDDLVVKFKGTAEEKELLRIQRMYDKAFAESKQIESKQGGKTQYSTNTDNQGRQLSKQQQEYFKDSKVRDENGKLRVMYHGTGENFTVFADKFIGENNGNSLGQGYYFSSNRFIANSYKETSIGANPKLMEVYLNIEKPFDFFGEGDLLDKAEYFKNKYGVSQIEGKLKFNLHALGLIKSIASENNIATSEILQDLGYDGIIAGNEIVAFEPNQIKNVDNLNPTENEDIRYSVETREVDFPEKVGDRYLSRHAKTLAESGVTMPETVDLIEKMVKDGSLTHERITDKKALAYAEKYIEENGFKDAVDHWNHLTKSNRELSKEELALGQLIFNTADTNQDVQLVKKMIADLVVKGTQAGRSLQAMSMVKKMTPDGRLYSLERTVQKLNQDLREQFGKDFKDIEIPDDLAEKLLKSKTTKETDAAVEEIQQYIADRVPATWGDKANAWRYLAMLGNPRTHIRNVLGNAVFIPAVEIKNLIATGIEKTLPKAERTKAVVGFKDTDLLNFAESDFDTHQEAVRGENKYDITAGVQEKQRVFNNKVLETLRKKNFELLEKEDATFLKYHYKRAMASALKARGITLKELRSGTPESIKKLDQVRQYAINEAQKATYRDFNSMANWVSSQKRRLKRASGTSKAAKVGSMVAEGIIPFTKTPANILKRGIEYSPVGLGKGIYDAMTQVKKGNVTASQAIDEMAAGLTGTGIVMLGALLKSLGLIVGGDEEKQKEQNFEKLKGNQNYALKIGNKTYTIDWMAPSSMPLFVGVEVVDLLEAENISDIIGSIGNITEPVFELSMLQGLNSTMNTLGSDNPIAETFSNTVESYFGQYNPTFLGQIARTIDPKRRTTYADKNSIVPSALQTFAQKQLQKIPFASKTLPTYKDQFGRESETENVVERIFSNFMSPGYLADVKDQPVENELTKLYEKTGESAILPSYASKSITVDKQKKNLTAKEYDTFAKVRGNVAYDNLEKLMTSQEYKSMDDEQKIKAIKKIYDYANSVGKSKVSDYELTKSEQQIQDYEKAGIDYYKWLILQDKADTNKNGYVTKDEMNKALNKSSLTSTQKSLIKKNMNKSK